MTMSAGFFESFKMTWKHLDRDINLGQVSVRPNHDKDGALEGHTIFTNIGYTINIHNTTSRLTVNGMEYRNFKELVTTLVDSIDPQYVTQFNKLLLQHLQALKEGDSTERAAASKQPQPEKKAIEEGKDNKQFPERNKNPAKSNSPPKYQRKRDHRKSSKILRLAAEAATPVVITEESTEEEENSL